MKVRDRDVTPRPVPSCSPTAPSRIQVHRGNKLQPSLISVLSKAAGKHNVEIRRKSRAVPIFDQWIRSHADRRDMQ